MILIQTEGTAKDFAIVLRSVPGRGVPTEGGPDEASGGGPGQQGVEEAPGFGTLVSIEAAPYVSLEVNEGRVADANFVYLFDHVEGVGQGFTVGPGHGPLVAEVLGDAAGADHGEGKGEFPLQGVDPVSYLTQ